MPRSIISEPTRKTLGYIKKHVSKMTIIKFKTGKKVFDWVVQRNGTLRMLILENLMEKKY